MTLAEVTAELVKVDAAIDRCLEAQAYSISGRSKQSPMLATLYKRKNQLEDLKSKLSTTDGGCVRNPIFGNFRG